jgi:hypothetical protein
MRWAGFVAHMEEIRNAYKIVFRNSDEMRSLRRSRLLWEDNSRMNFKETGSEELTGLNWLRLRFIGGIL